MQTETPVQPNLRYGCDQETADRICCFNRHYAEHSGYFATTKYFDEVDTSVETTYYDSVTGKPLFIAPRGRTFEEFKKESLAHGIFIIIWFIFISEISMEFQVGQASEMKRLFGTVSGVWKTARLLVLTVPTLATTYPIAVETDIASIWYGIVFLFLMPRHPMNMFCLPVYVCNAGISCWKS